MLTIWSSSPRIPRSAALNYCPPMGLADRIKEARLHAGFTQEQLGERIGVTKQAVTQWERDRNPPSRDNLTAISQQTDVPIDWLIHGLPLPERTPGGKLVFRGNRGRTVPLVEAPAAVRGDFDAQQAIRIPTVFPSGERAFAIAIDDRSNEPVMSVGDRAVFDPDVTAKPDDIAIVAAGAQQRPVIGRLRFETVSTGIVTVVQPLNSSYPSARSDHESLVIIGVLQELTKSMRDPQR